ncbi:SHOCT domain-containing protein [Thiohalorhabdus methylotrophus]|uniref:SHOCT domain-containing protein n=1 Tax=Thiohalorhabdus methylotrophus TaxID=3242694 RepID=A0ABV4TT52_9GAMM
MHDGYGMWGLGGIFMILFWVLAILAIAALVRWLALGPGGSARDGGEVEAKDRRARPLEILEERYARGEIDREEFLEKKEDLSE